MISEASWEKTLEAQVKVKLETLRLAWKPPARAALRAFILVGVLNSRHRPLFNRPAVSRVLLSAPLEFLVTGASAEPRIASANANPNPQTPTFLRSPSARWRLRNAPSPPRNLSSGRSGQPPPLACLRGLTSFDWQHLLGELRLQK